MTPGTATNFQVSSLANSTIARPTSGHVAPGDGIARPGLANDGRAYPMMTHGAVTVSTVMRATFPPKRIVGDFQRKSQVVCKGVGAGIPPRP